MRSDRVDFAVIGAGMAGASVAAELAGRASVILLEMEAQPGYHTTGRSAAMFAPGYGPAPIRALTRASAGFFNAPPEGFAQDPLLSQRDVLMVARKDQSGSLNALWTELSGEVDASLLDADETAALHPLLRAGYASGGLLDRSGSDIDVDALHQGYLRLFRSRGGTIRTNARVRQMAHGPQGWRIETDAGPFVAAAVVNAAGAWAEDIGRMAGAEPIGLVPKRRTAMMIDAPKGADVAAWPLTVDIDEAFYMKPDAGRLLLSPANEDPMPPQDTQPEDLDIALCVDRIERAFDIEIRRIGTKWAGLRSFVADKCPVAGFSDRAPGFFWLAGQGGYGIQSAPALARLAASLALQEPAPGDITAQGLDLASISPRRLAQAA